MRTLKGLIFVILLGVLGAIILVLSIVLLPLAIFVLVGLLVYLGYRVIIYENNDPPM